VHRQRTLLKTAKAGISSDSVLSLGWKRVRQCDFRIAALNQHQRYRGTHAVSAFIYSSAKNDPLRMWPSSAKSLLDVLAGCDT